MLNGSIAFVAYGGSADAFLVAIDSGSQSVLAIVPRGDASVATEGNVDGSRLFAMISHNLLRFVSLMNNPEAPQMAKKTRRKFINFPSKYLERSKMFWLKVPEAFYKGVIAFIEGWRFPEKVSAHMLSTA